MNCNCTCKENLDYSHKFEYVETEYNKSKFNMNVKLLDEHSILPQYQKDDDAGMDLHANTLREGHNSIGINPFGWALIKTGIFIELPKGTMGRVCSRSGLALRQGVQAHQGVIDNGYRGEVCVILYNYSNDIFIVNHGDRIAQLVICPYESVKINVVDELSETQRGSGGFGHTGA